jgi:hypothetical protein
MSHQVIKINIVNVKIGHIEQDNLNKSSDIFDKHNIRIDLENKFK